MKNKRCNSCCIFKPRTEFYKNKSRFDGLSGYCKECENIIQKENKKTIKGLITTIYGQQKSSSKIRNHPQPTYSKSELRIWLLSQPHFNKLYKNWIESGYKKDLKPSVDRKEDNKSYSFDNIQLMTWEENNKKGNETRKTKKLCGI